MCDYLNMGAPHKKLYIEQYWRMIIKKKSHKASHFTEVIDWLHYILLVCSPARFGWSIMKTWFTQQIVAKWLMLPSVMSL